MYRVTAYHVVCVVYLFIYFVAIKFSFNIRTLCTYTYVSAHITSFLRNLFPISLFLNVLHGVEQKVLLHFIFIYYIRDPYIMCKWNKRGKPYWTGYWYFYIQMLSTLYNFVYIFRIISLWLKCLTYRKF